MKRIFLAAGLMFLWGYLCAMPLMAEVSAKDDARTNSRELRYKPDASDFVFCGSKPEVYTRALYGNNQAFRLETGDIPAFGFYGKNGMLGNVAFALMVDGELFWLKDADNIEVRYRPGQRIYHIRDSRLGDKASLTLRALARYDKEGALFVIEAEGLKSGLQWVCQFGGVRGRKFSRNGDLGADPWDAFCLKKDYCHFNRFDINKNRFKVWYGAKNDISQYFVEDLVNPELKIHSLYGSFPAKSKLTLADPENVLQAPADSDYPTLRAQGKLKNGQSFFVFSLTEDARNLKPKQLYASTLDSIDHLQQHLQIYTPDPYINAAAGALVMAADGIWESPVYQHGAIGWRIALAGWRGAYTADPLAWNERAEEHFRAYAASQMTTPPDKGIMMDTALNIARSAKIKGTPMYSEGYIARHPNSSSTMNHYDMNICYIDELLRHLRWTGDLDFARELWPVLQRHLAWEKRCFDTNDDGLYDAYCCIWASDALEYSGGSVTHSSAYHYFANSVAARIASLIGENPEPYRKEAAKILTALNRELWLPQAGHWAEYKDVLGKQLLHPDAALWSIYHSIDSKVPTSFQAYQALRYIDTQIPHFPVKIQGQRPDDDEALWVPATTDWMPYHWSINNVAFAEVMHTALAYFQGGRPEEAYRVMKGALMDGMFLGRSPGNVGQVSFYDAARGETYRDFADPVGVYARCFVEGLFGVEPDLLNNMVLLRPSFPQAWDTAHFETPYLNYSFGRDAQGQRWHIVPNFRQQADIVLQVPVYRSRVDRVLVNGQRPKTQYFVKNSIGKPVLQIVCSQADSYEVQIFESGEALGKPVYPKQIAQGEEIPLSLPQACTLKQIYDPQGILAARDQCGHHTYFVELGKGPLSWWEAIDVEILPRLEIVCPELEAEQLLVQVYNHSAQPVQAEIWLNHRPTGSTLQLPAHSLSQTSVLEGAQHGSNLVELRSKGQVLASQTLRGWQLPFNASVQKRIDLKAYYNDRIDDIFAYGKYMSPRAQSTSLQLPSQGYGEWCVPKTLPEIDAGGLRHKADSQGIFLMPQGLTFNICQDSLAANTLFVSQWDNYPSQTSIALDGICGTHAYLLMAGSTNHQQCHLANGIVRVHYSDGSQDSLLLVNPETWAPVEQDFYVDGLSFRLEEPRPYRVQLSTGLATRNLERDLQLKGVEYSTGRAIPGGAAIMLDLPLRPDKPIKSISLEANTIESVIGLMALTITE